jgi:hypothetical protein
MYLKKILLFLMIAFSFLGVEAQRSDMVVFNAGNRVKGEVKHMKYGALFYETDDAGDMNIDWINVVKVKSKGTYDITLKDHRRFEGSLDSTANNGEAVIVSNGQRTVVAILDIVEITELQNSFLSRIDGFLHLGFSYTKGSKVILVTSGAEVNYRSFTDEVSLGGNIVFTRQGISDTTVKNKKQNLDLDYRRFFKNRWFLFATTGIEQNTELGLSYRFYAGGGIGKSLFETNVQMMRMGLGAIYTREESDENTRRNNAEGVAEIYYKVFKKTMPKLSLTSSLIAYPNFTDAGRVRLNGDISFDTEVISDFTIGLSSYHNYDNRPVSSTASTYDWGIVFNLGYSF